MSFADDALLATELIESFDPVDIPYRRETPGALTPATDDSGAPTVGEQTARGFTFPMRAPRESDIVQATSVISTMRRVLLTASSLTWIPEPQIDAVYTDGVWWTVLGCTSFRPDGATSLFHSLVVQR